MKIAMAQTNPIIGGFEKNGENIINQARKAREAGCDIVIFPEMAISGYPPGDLLEKDDFIHAQLNRLDLICRSIHGIGVLLGFVDKRITGQRSTLYNSAIFFEDEKVLFTTDKRLLPSYDIFDESRYFKQGKQSSPFSYKGQSLGITICEDLWNDGLTPGQKQYDQNPVADLADQGASLLINISASPFHTGKDKIRLAMLRDIAGRRRIPLIYVNQVGGNDSLIFDGMSTAIDAHGHTIARALDFEEDLVIVNTDTNAQKSSQVNNSEMESLLKALTLGTRDYIRKCGFSRAVIGSSGGIDSALTTAIAVRALGKENVLTIFMPSIYTSPQNLIDTKQLAKNLGTAWQEIPISPMYKEFLKISADFNMENPGLAEQNLQARIRGTILMAISNRDSRILLATGNKSEMAVGYSTLYGDMCGGLAVIGDLPKNKVYELSRQINQNGEIIPESILTKAPSAELKPDQTDQDDLPSYNTIDAVVTGYVEQHKTIDDLVAQGWERADVLEIVTRINRNEYKRYQAPPILRVTKKAFGTGRRQPMAHGL